MEKATCTDTYKKKMANGEWKTYERTRTYERKKKRVFTDEEIAEIKQKVSNQVTRKRIMADHNLTVHYYNKIIAT